MSKRVDEMLKKLASCPPGPRAQIDDQITPKLLDLVGLPDAEQAVGLKTILDTCAYGALATDFGMMVMDSVWKMAKEDADATA